MPYVTDARPLIQAAYREGSALPAFNVCSLEMARGCVLAAQELNRPILLQTYPADIEQASPHVFAQMTRALADEVSVPVGLHLDHGRDFAQVVACLRAGYSSVMFDGQGLPFGEVLVQTRHLAEIAHAAGASLEVSAESFGVPGAEDNVLETTDPRHAAQVREAGADMVACAVGSEHGHESRLDLALLRSVADAVNGPLVLHGGSGIQPDDLRAALTCGVVKVNVGSALYRAVLGAWREAGAGTSHRQGSTRVRGAVREVARTYIERLSPQPGPQTLIQELQP
ncbi:class II fructose-bisphosphate aldolase (plasmid) [Deinococcus metallilatus]|uniref:Class II fructose-bisphosphate aldolase n=1 Tax=Deinococcus metallilatus TaxID=1211322 RepID=A0AAJ5K005_9DEIO|nr:class II fructose-bisphosphate aldolase [Deinococcus metallilatus]MBB5295630.1 fructose-bisphosphate aldolase class II [Deinococcus metallilatus]QBY06909.1 class II fructose-bisphosphate aldolase [Deinococcus metallilatus]TLK32299.1 class II fructose-bisphosphate aldolase [Deinococcus metallilatus]GMA14159.1 fructose-bisphosphate aldolase [Deinococcus metallilatus]